MYQKPVKNPIPEGKQMVPSRGATGSQRRRHVSEKPTKVHGRGMENTKILKLCSSDTSDQTYGLSDQISLTIPAGAMAPNLKETLMCSLWNSECCSLELDRDEEAVLSVLHIMSKQELEFRQHVILKFAVASPVNGWINCYKQEAGNSFWEYIEKQGNDTFMRVYSKYVSIYSKHFTKFVCTCQRFPEKLGLDIVILGKHYSECSPKSAHEVEIKVYTFDKIKDTQELDDFVKNARQHTGTYVCGIFRDVMTSVKDIRRSDNIRFTLSLDEHFQDWKDPMSNTEIFQQIIPIQHLLECHTRRRNPRPDAAQFILHTQKKGYVRFAATLAVAIKSKENPSGAEAASLEAGVLLAKDLRFSISLSESSSESVQAASSSATNQEDHGHLIDTRKPEVDMSSQSSTSPVSSLGTSPSGRDRSGITSHMSSQTKPDYSSTGQWHDFQSLRQEVNVPKPPGSSMARHPQKRLHYILSCLNLDLPMSFNSHSKKKAPKPAKY